MNEPQPVRRVARLVHTNLVLLETMQCARFLLKQSIEFVELLHFGL
ncbi:hypothetical protein ALC53_03597 [Atta colombica]|uniref:Uncharacterized protein n=1 Tax=Atta colombica TaxID=520822 RepID=A0A151I516_9HYME|nr:hypothetical protein ALC53_03597 [Atta colombica]